MTAPAKRYELMMRHLAPMVTELERTERVMVEEAPMVTDEPRREVEEMAQVLRGEKGQRARETGGTRATNRERSRSLP